MAFVMVLSYSRHLFLRFYLNSAMANFLRGHVDSFAYFDSVPRVVLYDNLKSAVLERRDQAIHFNPTLLELTAHYQPGVYGRPGRHGGKPVQATKLHCQRRACLGKLRWPRKIRQVVKVYSTAERRIELTDEQTRLPERFSPEFRELHIETRHTDDQVAVDTFFIGHLKGVGNGRF